MKYPCCEKESAHHLRKMEEARTARKFNIDELGFDEEEAEEHYTWQVRWRQRRLGCVPTSQASMKEVLIAASKEMKHVFGVIGVTRQDFACVVLHYNMRNIEMLVNPIGARNFSPEIFRQIDESLCNRISIFCKWYSRFAVRNQRLPNLLEEFGKGVWCKATMSAGPILERRVQPLRKCKRRQYVRIDGEAVRLY